MKGKLPLSLKQDPCILLLPVSKSTHASQSKRAGMPSLGREEWGGERRLAFHCIILAAINSLCPVGE